MKVFKGKFRDALLCIDTDEKGLKNKYYLDIHYKAGITPPTEDYNAEFIMKTSDGVEHECFFTCYKNEEGITEPLLIVLS